MLKNQIASFASANGFSANYSGKNRTWHFTNRATGATASRRLNGKGLTAKMLSNTFGKAA